MDQTIQAFVSSIVAEARAELEKEKDAALAGRKEMKNYAVRKTS